MADLEFKTIEAASEIADGDYILTVSDGEIKKVAKADANLGGNSGTLSPATTEKLGGVIIGDGINVNESGKISIDSNSLILHKVYNPNSPANNTICFFANEEISTISELSTYLQKYSFTGITAFLPAFGQRSTTYSYDGLYYDSNVIAHYPGSSIQITESWVVEKIF